MLDSSEKYRLLRNASMSIEEMLDHVIYNEANME
jgi:hypothetical protein